MRALTLLLITLSFSAQARTPITFNTLANQVLKDFGISQIQTFFPEKDVAKQEINARNTFDFQQALEIGLKTFLKDTGDLESPLSIAAEEVCNQMLLTNSYYECYTENGDYQKEILKKAKDDLLKFLDSSESEISIIKTTETGFYGESIQKNWIFKLYAPKTGDHSYWVIIDRKGEKTPFTYGFN